ncbi:MAG: hypothetical protein P0S95_03455 [Rhabdochlamydiaceae bacterium]|nr:hypothetical protein [Candidatus Amphrikana amoebophyrae]
MFNVVKVWRAQLTEMTTGLDDSQYPIFLSRAASAQKIYADLLEKLNEKRNIEVLMCFRSSETPVAIAVTQPKDQKNCAWLWLLCVRPNLIKGEKEFNDRPRGVGTFVLNYLKETVKSFELGADMSAVGFYKKNGLRVISSGFSHDRSIFIQMKWGL